MRFIAIILYNSNKANFTLPGVVKWFTGYLYSHLQLFTGAAEFGESTSKTLTVQSNSKFY